MRAVKDLILDPVNLFVYLLNEGHVSHYKGIHDSVQQMIGSILDMPDIPLTGGPGFFHSGKDLIMVGNDVVTPEEDIQFIYLRVEDAIFLFVIHHIEYHIDVIPPVIDFGSVGLLQGIVNGKGMKTETAQDRLRLFRRFADEIDPEHTFSITKEPREFRRGNIGADGFSGRVKKGSDQNDLQNREFCDIFTGIIDYIEIDIDNINFLLDKIEKMNIILLEKRQ